MNDYERLVLAALVHDLSALFRQVATDLSPGAKRVLKLAGLDDMPFLATILEQAETCARPHGEPGQLATDQRLVSIFSRVQLWQTAEPAPAYHRFAPLPATEASFAEVFPLSTEAATGAATPALADQVKLLADALGWLGETGDLSRFEPVYHHLLALLQQYGWCVPSHSPDLALVDHAKLTAAIAAALYRYHEGAGSLNSFEVQADAEAAQFCLLAGDLSGIQDYIFAITTIGPGGVARRLRARSFYLSVIADIISHQVAHQFDLPLGNVIMASGGKFYVLLPNQADIAARIQAFRAAIDGWFKEQLNAEIALNMAFVPFAGGEFQASGPRQRGFGGVLYRLSQQLNREKQRRGQSILTNQHGWHESSFILHGQNQNFWGAGVCLSCGKFPVDEADSDNSREGLCEKCGRDVAVGRRLPGGAYVAYYQAEPESRNKANIPLPGGYWASVLAANELAEAGRPYLITKLNDPDLAELLHYPATFRYLANYVPTDRFGAQLSFEDIAGMAAGRKLLGYIKADVDYLGILFAQGLRRDSGGYDTAAHVTALSRELDRFFSGWIQHTLSTHTDYSGFYTIFSGGDDLFLVGPWDKAADLARDINAELATFVSHNPDITLSAGILFTKERYPISRAATDAEDVLELSKERIWRDEAGRKRQRNQLTILGDTFRWAEAPAIFEQIDMLSAQADKLTSAFLYNLVQYGQLYQLWLQDQSVDGPRYKPLFAYNIARNLRRGDAALYRWADSLMQSLNVKNHTSVAMQHIGLIATYLLFTKREP